MRKHSLLESLLQAFPVLETGKQSQLVKHLSRRFLLPRQYVRQLTQSLWLQLHLVFGCKLGEFLEFAYHLTVMIDMITCVQR